MRNTLRIGFAWQTLSSENLGVAALAEANLAIARNAASKLGLSIDAIEFCPAGPNTALNAMRDCALADPLSPKKMLLGRSRYAKQVAECDAILDIGAGDSFSDIYGKKHFGFLCLSKYLALRNKVPLVLSPQTIGPFSSDLVARVAVHLMRRAECVFARDSQSMDYLRSLGVHHNAREVIDVAFRLPFERRPKANDGLVHVGVNVSGLLYNGGYTKNNQFGLRSDYRALIEALLRALAAQPGTKIHLVAHVISSSFEVEDDYRVCEALARALPNAVVAPRFDSPSAAKSYISGLDFFTGARMHACIGAFSSGVPVVPMAYSRKFSGLFGSLHYSHLVDMTADDESSSIQKVLNGLSNRSKLAGEIAQGNALAQYKIQDYEDALVRLFGRLSVA